MTNPYDSPQETSDTELVDVDENDKPGLSRSAANVLLLFVGAIWGMAFIAQQTAMEDMPAILFIGLRFLLAAAVVAPLAVRESYKVDEPTSKKIVFRSVVLGLVFFTAMCCQQLGLLGTTVTNAGFLTALYVVMVPIGLLIVFHQRQPTAVWGASLVSILGIFLLSGGSLSGISWGDWLVVVCAVFWAVHVILVGRFASETKRPITMATIQFFVCGVVALAAHIVCGLAGWVKLGLTAEVFFAALPEILYAGALAGGLAFTLQIIAQQHTSPSIAAILMGSESLFAAIFGAIILGDRLKPIGYLGCALIFAAVLAVELWPEKTSAANLDS